MPRGYETQKLNYTKTLNFGSTIQKYNHEIKKTSQIFVVRIFNDTMALYRIDISGLPAFSDLGFTLPEHDSAVIWFTSTLGSKED